MTFFKKATMAASVSVLTIMTAPSAFAQDDFTIKLGGRLHVDYASASSDNTDLTSVQRLCDARALKVTVNLVRDSNIKSKRPLMRAVMSILKTPICHGNPMVAL